MLCNVILGKYTMMFKQKMRIYCEQVVYKKSDKKFSEQRIKTIGLGRSKNSLKYIAQCLRNTVIVPNFRKISWIERYSNTKKIEEKIARADCAPNLNSIDIKPIITWNCFHSQCISIEIPEYIVKSRVIWYKLGTYLFLCFYVTDNK